MKNEPERAFFERIVVDPIETGYLVRIMHEADEKTYAFISYRQVLRFLKDVNKESTENE